MFPRRKIHKYTWTYPVGKKKQIDHVLFKDDNQVWGWLLYWRLFGGYKT
jgi:hypothetical protein